MFLVRPFLDIPKARLIATLARANVPFAEDPSNRDPRFTRPRLRGVMPALAGEGLDAARLALLARRLRRADAAIEMAVDVATAALSRGALVPPGAGHLRCAEICRTARRIGIAPARPCRRPYRRRGTRRTRQARGAVRGPSRGTSTPKTRRIEAHARRRHGDPGPGPDQGRACAPARTLNHSPTSPAQALQTAVDIREIALFPWQERSRDLN